MCVCVCALHTGTKKKPSHLDALWHWHKCLLFWSWFQCEDTIISPISQTLNPKPSGNLFSASLPTWWNCCTLIVKKGSCVYALLPESFYVQFDWTRIYRGMREWSGRMQQVSLARYLSGAGFDTWILEVRGAGLSKRRGEPTAAELGSVDGVPSRAVEDTLVSSTIKSATKVSSHMEKHIDKTNEGRDENGVALENDSTVSGGSTRSASTAHESTMAVEEKIGPSTTDAAITAIKQKEEASAKDEPAKTWNSSMVLQVSEKYKHLLQVDQLWLFSSKSIKKVSVWCSQYCPLWSLSA